MRAVLKDVLRGPHPDGFRESFLNWWEEWPARHRHFWRELLFEPGQGWLRWGIDERDERVHVDEGLSYHESYVVAPPLRRIAWWVKGNLNAPRLMLFEHLSWEESVLGFSDCWGWYIDKDRHQNLWGYTGRRRR